MANTQPQGSQEVASEDSTWSSASKLSGKVRELAHRSHRALKAWTLSRDNPDDSCSTTWATATAAASSTTGRSSVTRGRMD